VDNADAIAAIPGVDVLFVGPRDLSHDLGVPGDVLAPVYVEALARLQGAVQRHGKACGVLVPDGTAAATLREQGWRFLGIGSDCLILAGGLGAAVERARA